MKLHHKLGHCDILAQSAAQTDWQQVVHPHNGVNCELTATKKKFSKFCTASIVRETVQKIQKILQNTIKLHRV